MGNGRKTIATVHRISHETIAWLLWMTERISTCWASHSRAITAKLSANDQNSALCGWSWWATDWSSPIRPARSTSGRTSRVIATAAMASTKVSSRSRSRDRSVEDSVDATANTLGRGARRAREHRRDILEQLEPIIERTAVHQLQGDVGVAVDRSAPVRCAR